MKKKNHTLFNSDNKSTKTKSTKTKNNLRSLGEEEYTLHIDGENYSLTAIATGSNFCPGLITLNCLQMEYTLTQLKRRLKADLTEASDSFTFKIARSIQDDGTGKSTQAFIQLLKGCLDENSLDKMVQTYAKDIFLGNGIKSDCAFTTQALNNVKMVVSSSNIDTVTCTAVTNELTSIFQTCQRKAESKALEIGLGVTAFTLLVIGVAYLYLRSKKNIASSRDQNNTSSGYHSVNSSQNDAPIISY